MKKIGFYSIIIFTFILVSILVFSSFNRSLEDSLIGKWEETYWEYKEADKYLLKGLGFQNDVVYSGDIRFHKGEVWIFQPGGRLEILDGTTSNTLKWSLKGRGNILEISDGTVTEHFDIKKIENGQIELQFISDIQVREEAKLIFTQISKT